MRLIAEVRKEAPLLQGIKVEGDFFAVNINPAGVVRQQVTFTVDFLEVVKSSLLSGKLSV